MAVVAGTTFGMMLANVPAVILGDRLADNLPVKAIRMAAAVLFGLLGVLTQRSAAVINWRTSASCGLIMSSELAVLRRLTIGFYGRLMIGLSLTSQLVPEMGRLITSKSLALSLTAASRAVFVLV